MVRRVLFAVCSLMAVALALTPSYGIDFIDWSSGTTMQCLLNNYYWTSTRIFHDAGGGACDSTGGQNVRTAVDYGVSMSPYIFPNPGSIGNGHLSAQQQVDMGIYCGVMNGLPVNKTLFYLDIEVDPYNPWPDCQTSADYILEMIAAVWKFFPYAGVYSSHYEWQQVTCQGDPESAEAKRFVERLHEVAESLSRPGVELDSVLNNERVVAAFDKARVHTNDPIVQDVASGGGRRRSGMKKRPVAANPLRVVIDPRTDVMPHPTSAAYLAANDARIAAMEKAGRRVGQKFGARNGASGKDLFLWYANWDGQANFNDFSPFGPFKGALAKQYSDDCNVCGMPCDSDWSNI